MVGPRFAIEGVTMFDLEFTLECIAAALVFAAIYVCLVFAFAI